MFTQWLTLLHLTYTEWFQSLALAKNGRSQQVGQESHLCVFWFLHAVRPQKCSYLCQ